MRRLSPQSIAGGVAYVALLAACGESGGVSEGPIEYVQTFSDDFDGAQGQAPNPDYWTYDIGIGPNGDGWGNGQCEYDTDAPENVSLDGRGLLRIAALESNPSANCPVVDTNAIGGIADETRKYTSGRILTVNRVEQRYGRIEARIQVPVGRGLWPAFWMLGAEIDDGKSWPQVGEIDIMEFRGERPTEVLGTIHGPGYAGGDAIGSVYVNPEGEGFDERFHVYAIEWDPSRITWYVDDVAYQTRTLGDVFQRGEWVFDRPFFILLNLAVGSYGFVQVPDASTVFPATMLVDYVRIFEKP